MQHTYRIGSNLVVRRRATLRDTKITDVPARWLGGNYHYKRLPIYGRLKSLIGQTQPGCASYLALVNPAYQG
jgi:hypothetical protein